MSVSIKQQRLDSHLAFVVSALSNRVMFSFLLAGDWFGMQIIEMANSVSTLEAFDRHFLQTSHKD